MVVDGCAPKDELKDIHMYLMMPDTPRFEEEDNLSIYCQGATGLPFDENPKGAVAFLTVGETVDWEVVRYDYDVEAMINLLEDRQPPFYTNLQNTVRYAAIKNE